MKKLGKIAKPYRVEHGKHFRLKDFDPGDTGKLGSREEATADLESGVEQLRDLQDKLYAQENWGLLVILQGMDAAGKDSVIKHVMSGVNPQGCQVYSFKHPGPEELAHDFLWNATRHLPERGRIGIFNRSYYEEVLIVRVHPEILAGQGLPEEMGDPGSIWRDRYRSIVNLEDHLHRNGTRVIKFFLHVSKEEQRKRFLKRIDEPDKNWKFSIADIKERECWKQYMQAYEACLSATSTRTAPWYVVPADDKENARLIVSRVILDTLRELKMAYPKSDPERRRELQAIRELLEKEKPGKR